MAQQGQWDPWLEVQRLQRDLQGLFERSQSASSAEGQLPINITYTSDGVVVVEALCPGVDKETLDVTVIGDTLTIKGERPPESGVANARYHRRQRVTGAFTRTVRLAERIDADHVMATYAHGILVVQLRPAPEASPKRVTIRT